MRKYTIYFLFTTLILTTIFSSCTSVYDDIEDLQTPKVKLLPTRILNEETGYFLDLEYDNFNRLKRVQKSGPYNDPDLGKIILKQDSIVIVYDGDGDITEMSNFSTKTFYSYNETKDTVVNSKVYESELVYGLKYIKIDTKGNPLSSISTLQINLRPREYLSYFEYAFIDKEIDKKIYHWYLYNSTLKWHERRFTETHKYDDKNAIFSCVNTPQWIYVQIGSASTGVFGPNIFSSFGMGKGKNNLIHKNVNVTFTNLEDNVEVENFDNKYDFSYTYNEYGYPIKVISQRSGEKFEDEEDPKNRYEVTIEYKEAN